MNRQAIVGLFTLLGLAALFAVFLVLANVGTGGRYLTAVHFKSAAGLHRGALVYESGVIVGVVEQTRLLPEDFTVDIIMAINNSVDVPRNSRFLIAAPLTGDATVEIVPPAPKPRPAGLVGPTPVPQTAALLPRQVLPIEQQPQGTNPATIGDLLEQGQGEVHRLDRMLAQLEVSEPKLLASLQSALDNANDLTSQGSKRLYRLADRLDALTLTLQVAMDAGSKNIVDMTGVLDTTARRNSANVDTMLTMLSKSSVALNQTVDQVRDLASNPQLHKNLL
ncbi:MAG TPA: MlaD family protein, partial [Candidatus Lustribacter sp.]